MASDDAKLPTYREAANVLEKQKGSGLRLLGWTVARTFLIAPPVALALAVVPSTSSTMTKAFVGAAIASGFISIFTLMRLFDARTTGLGAIKRDLCRAPALAGSRYRSRRR